jgi:hypothetical protein
MEPTTLLFPPVSPLLLIHATATVTVDPTADTTVESDETVALTLASGTGYTVGTTTAVTGTITNDDFSQLSINDITTVVEGKDSNASPHRHCRQSQSTTNYLSTMPLHPLMLLLM